MGIHPNFRSDPVDCSWSGRWMGSEDAFNFYCRFDPEQGKCGKLECSVNHPLFKAHNSSFIGEFVSALAFHMVVGADQHQLIRFFGRSTVHCFCFATPTSDVT